MSGILLRAALLLGIYLLVLTSTDPGDVLLGSLLGLGLAGALRPRGAPRRRGTPSLARLRAAGAVLLQTAAEMVRGSWRTARFCLGAPATPGFVEIPRGDRSRHNVAMWGVLTGEAPDEVPVDVDEERDVLIVHLIDAAEPDAVRARHRRNHERWQRRVVP
jgi:multisubunit Na+/H+ antiporter MnhE subunit